MLTLSKSDFKTGLDCPTRLFYKESGGYASTNDYDPYLQLLAEGGYMVEQLAKRRYPDGVEGSRTGDLAEDARQTMASIRAGNVTIFEATLLLGRRLARVDILQRSGNTLRLIEVKSKSFDSVADRERAELGKPNIFWTTRKPYSIASNWHKYIADVTYQTLIAESLFPEFRVEPYLCLVDKAVVGVVDKLPEYFTIAREALVDGRSRLITVQFTGTNDIVAAAQLTVELRVRDEVNALREDVSAKTEELLQLYEPELRKAPPSLGLVCKDCEYRVRPEDVGDDRKNGFAECWGAMANVTPSVLDIFSVSSIKLAGESVAERLIALGTPGVHDIPDDVIDALAAGKTNAQRQHIQITHTKRDEEFVGDGIGAAIESVRYPLYFIDFEAARLAIPFHSGMRPYGLLAFQWSCHIVDAPGAPLRHLEWINTEREWPNAAFFQTLADATGGAGTILTWSQFEVSTLRTIRDELVARGALDERLAAWVAGLVGATEGAGPRVLDMHKLTRNAYFHPGMAGSTSIKMVLDALWTSDQAMRDEFATIMGRTGDPTVGPYASLEPLVIAGVSQAVAEGTGAVRAYEALMFGQERHEADVQRRWRQLLLEYCKLDTLAMVLIWEYWKRTTSRVR